VAGACAGPPSDPALERAASITPLDPPASTGAFAPWLAVARPGLLLSWLEPLAEGGHRFVVSRHTGAEWSQPVEIARGDDFFANWADVPGLGVAGDGALLAHWLVKTGAETYAYSIMLARSTDGGARWNELGPLHDDGTPTEHGFVSWAPEGESARAVWLDGRALAEGGPMSLRTALVGAAVGAATILDDRVCECCSTDLAVGSDGALVVYRDRSAGEVRDVALARIDGATPPVVVWQDGWEIAGCPVNGPAIEGDGDRVAVVWFTAAGGRPRVFVALSTDAGKRFSAPRRVDLGNAVGRVDVRLDPAGGAVVAWLETVDDGAAVLLRRFADDGTAGDAVEIGRTASGRTSGFPRLAPLAADWMVAWVEADGEGPRRLRAATLRRAGL
jgi:hypothetical protein